MRTLWNRFDALLIPALLAAALLFHALYGAAEQNEAGKLEVILGGDTVMTVSLKEDRIFSPPGLPEVLIEVKDGSAAFIDSDCPDRVCVKTGYIRERGRMAACLPNRVALRVVRGSGDDVPDAVI